MLDSRRRRLCRTLFAALCLAPTTALVGGAVFLRSSAHRQTVQTQLSQALGLAVSIDRVEYPQPGAARATGVALADPETGVTLARCDRLEWRWTHDRWHVSGGAAQFDAARGPLLAETVDRLLRRPVAQLPPRLTVSLARAAWDYGDRQCTLRDVACGFDTGAKGVLGQVRCSTREDAGEPVQFKLARDRTSQPPVTRWELNCNRSPLPAWLLLAATADPLRLGADAEFAGYAWIGRAAGGWEGQLTGRCTGIDLAAAMRDGAVELTGPAELAVQTLKFRAGRAYRLEATLAAGPGSVSAALVESLARELRLQVNRQALREERGPLAYRELVADLSLDGRGLTIRGGCGRADSNVVIASDRGPLLGDSQQPAPVAALLRGLAPQADAWPPGETVEWLAQHLMPTSPGALASGGSDRDQAMATATDDPALVGQRPVDAGLPTAPERR